MIKRILAVLLSLTTLAPSAVFAQASKAGVVTTLEGNVSARRVALPDSVLLKFKDDVFLQDTVTTADKSLARMLLGGKAVVTVRERSVITITEVPGRSTLELQTGKFALAVAREKMRPGEEIQIRTPNAIAGVRGTVVITEVNRQSAQAGGAAPAVLTNFYVLRGSLTAQPLDPTTRQPVGAPLQVGAMQAYSGAGNAPPSVKPVPPEQVGQITAGLQPTGPKGGSDAGQEQVKTQAVQTAVSLLTTLTGGSAIQAGFATAQPIVTTPVSAQTQTTVPIISFNASEADLTSAADAAEGALKQFVAFTGALTLTDTAKTFDGSFTSTSTSSFFQLTNATVEQIGAELDFVRLLTGANVTLAGPLVTFIDSSLTTPGSLFEMEGGTFTSSAQSALFSLDPTTVTAGAALIALHGGTLTLAGALLIDEGGTLDVAEELLSMEGATLVSTTTGALIQLTNTAVGASGAVGMKDSTMQLAGPLVIASGLTEGGSTELVAPVFSLDNSTITSTSASPLIQFSSMSVEHNDDNFLRLVNTSKISLRGALLKFTDTKFGTEADRSFIAVVDGSSIVTTDTNEALLSFSGTASGTSSVTAARNFFVTSFSETTLSPALTLSGPFLSASLTDFSNGNGASNTFSFLAIRDGAQVTSTSTSPFMTFTQSTVDTAGDVVSLRRSTSGTPSRLTLAGPLLTATNSTFTHTSLGFGSSFSTSPSACCSAFFIGQGAQLKSTTGEALIQLTGSTFKGADAQSGGSFFHVTDTFGGAPSGEVVAPSSVSLAGPLLKTTNSTITSLFDLVRVQRSTLSSTSTSPLVDITGGSVTLGGTNPISGGAAFGNLLDLFSSSAAGQAASAASVTLAGSLARLASTTFKAGDGNLVNVFNGATFTETGSAAMLQLDAATLTGFNLLTVSGLGGSGGTTKSSVTLAGPVLTASGSTTTLGSNVIAVLNGSSLTSTATSALVQISGGTLTAGTIFSGAALLQVNGGASPGLVTLNGPVLSAGSTVTIPGALLGTFSGGQLVVNSSTSPLYAFNGGTHSFGNASGADRDAAFILNGLSTQVSSPPESVAVLVQNESESCEGPCPLETQTQSVTVGTRKPVQHGGSLLESTGGTLTTNKLVRLDTALLDATAPILNLKSSANLTVATDAIDLIKAAKLTTSVSNPLVNLDASTLTVTSGSLLAVRAGSFLNVAGDAVQLANGATLNISNGTLLLASGDSVVKIAGALVKFGTGGGTVNITNTLCASTTCVPKGPFTVSLGPTANSSNVVIGSGAVTGGSLAPLPTNGAHISVDGANTRVNIAASGS